jgi:hypothetical protein
MFLFSFLSFFLSFFSVSPAAGVAQSILQAGYRMDEFQ